jgi:hypothetical protein
MKYTQLPTSYKYEVIANAVYGREVEYFHYDFDRINFEYLLNILPEGTYRDDVANRLKETLIHMKNVEAIMEALNSQIDDFQAYAEAIESVTAKRKAQEESCSTSK